MTQHKWHKEIKAWADGAEIEMRWTNGEIHDEWRDVHNGFNWNSDLAEFRIKLQPKKPQYLYVYARNGEINYMYEDPRGWEGEYIGRIKMENDDGN
jgi:hypothetical protein